MIRVYLKFAKVLNKLLQETFTSLRQKASIFKINQSNKINTNKMKIIFQAIIIKMEQINTKISLKNWEKLPIIFVHKPMINTRNNVSYIKMRLVRNQKMSVIRFNKKIVGAVRKKILWIIMNLLLIFRQINLNMY